jgi:CBS domain-containing membrane protein
MTRVGCIDITDEDVREAMKDLGTYVDISIEDLKALYAAAVRHAAQRMVTSLPVSRIMSRDVVTVRHDADIHEVSRLLSEHGISGLPVVDAVSCVIGVVTEADVIAMTGVVKGHSIKDLIRHLLGEPVPKCSESCDVTQVMSTPVIAISPDADIRKAAAIMNEKRIKRLPVIDSTGCLVGIVSRADIIKAMGMSWD